jgi:hypothetical protein
MRRLFLAFVVCLGIQLILPAPAHAWWGWWDELSGAGPFRGLEIEARIACFGEATPHPARDGTLAMIQRQFDYETSVLRTDPKANPELVRRLTTFNMALSAAVSNAITVDQLDSLAKAAAAIPRDGADERVQSVLRNLERDIIESKDRLVTLRNQRGSAGVIFSACPIGRDNNRRISINATFRLLNSYGDRKALYAGTNEIELAMFVPALAWRPLVDFSTIDVVDLSTGAGVYWFSSEAGAPGSFEPFRGVVLEPVRLDFHFPSKLVKRGFWGAALAGVSYRRGWAIFPAGFAADAFGMTDPPELARQIPGEWVKTQAIFWDFGPLIHWAKVGKTN